MPSQPEAQGDILKEFREGTFLSSLDRLDPDFPRIHSLLTIPDSVFNAFRV
jgi:hypothetical protein